MAASVLDGEKICEVAGNVRWSSVENLNLAYNFGSLALYKLSSSYYIHAISAFKRSKVKWQNTSTYCIERSALCQAYVCARKLIVEGIFVDKIYYVSLFSYWEVCGIFWKKVIVVSMTICGFFEYGRFERNIRKISIEVMSLQNQQSLSVDPTKWKSDNICKSGLQN